MKFRTYTGPEVREIRKKLNLNQFEFWSKFATTQSGGSRYESGREIPSPVQLLLNVAFAPDAKAIAIVDELRQLARPGQSVSVRRLEAKQ